jgi:REP element-mobilizing transposase RayT
MGRWLPMQLALPGPSTWGGSRAGAGRKPRAGRPSVRHDLRPHHDRHHPVQVTLRAVTGVLSLRGSKIFAAVRRAIAGASNHRFRVLHFSVQQDHAHFIVEADGHRPLHSGVHGLAIRIALSFNRVAGRRGRLWGDRYHARALTTPRAVRVSMAYVLLNFCKHLGASGGIDPCSSGPHFTGWAGSVVVAAGRPSTASPRTWLGRVGWTRSGGPLRFDEGPARAREGRMPPRGRTH